MTMIVDGHSVVDGLDELLFGGNVVQRHGDDVGDNNVPLGDLELSLSLQELDDIMLGVEGDVGFDMNGVLDGHVDL